MLLKKQNSRFYLMFLIGVLFFIVASSSSAFSYDPYKVFENEFIIINGDGYVEFDVSPCEESGRVLVPVRSIAESFGMKVNWDPNSKKVTISEDGNTVELIINSKEAKVNGKAFQIDVPARTVKGRTMLPLRFVGESLGKNVYYDGRFLFGGEWGIKKTIWVLDYNLLEEEDYSKAELEKNYYLADSQEYGTQNPYLLREGAITRRGIKLGDSIATIKEKYGIPAGEMTHDGKLILRYSSKFVPDTDAARIMDFSFKEGKLVELYLE